MTRRAVLLALCAPFAMMSCDRKSEDAATPGAAVPRQIAQPGQGPASKMPDMIPRPNDPAELDRLILAGYQAHDDHMHAPGVNECPMTKGTETVM